MQMRLKTGNQVITGRYEGGNKQCNRENKRELFEAKRIRLSGSGVLKGGNPTE